MRHRRLLFLRSGGETLFGDGGICRNFVRSAGHGVIIASRRLFLLYVESDVIVSAAARSL